MCNDCFDESPHEISTKGKTNEIKLMKKTSIIISPLLNDVFYGVYPTLADN